MSADLMGTGNRVWGTLGDVAILQTVPGGSVALRNTLGLAALLAALSPHSAVGQVDALDRLPSRFATLNGLRIHYKSLGTGRTAVVFVHCWACDLTIWRAQIPAVEGRARILLLDLPGHGRSSKPDTTYSMDLFTRSVNAVMEAAGVDRAVLVGHSMGTPVVRQFYRLFRAKTIGLVVVDGSLRRPLSDTTQANQLLRTFAGPDYRDRLKEMIDGAFGGPGADTLRRLVVQMARATPQNVVVGAMRALFDPAIWGDDSIDAPLLVVVARGPNWPPAYEAYVHSLAAHLRYEQVDGVGHFLMLERPDAFNPLLLDFLVERGLVSG